MYLFITQLGVNPGDTIVATARSVNRLYKLGQHLVLLDPLAFGPSSPGVEPAT